MDLRRASRTITISQLLALAILGTGVALTYRHGWFFSFLVIFVGGVFQTRQSYIGFMPVPTLSFRDRVKGEMLTGVSEGIATERVTKSYAFEAIWNTAMTAMATTIACLIALFPDKIDGWVGSILGHAALWIVGICVAFVVLPIVLYPFYKKGVRKG